MRRSFQLLMLALIMSLVPACAGTAPMPGGAPTMAVRSTIQLAAQPVPPATIRPSNTPVLTATLLPTATSAPTATPGPTATAVPTASPEPTVPPVPTATPALLGPGGLPFPLNTARLEFGVAAHLFYTNRAMPLQRANEAGFGWIRQQVHWKDLEGPPGRYAWGELDAIVNAVHTAKLKLLLSVVRAPSFYTGGGNGMPGKPESLGRFVAALAKQYQGKVQAIEIWNEQNLAHENGGRVSVEDAGHYVELLKAAYISIKQIDPAIYVIAGPPSSTGITNAGVAVDDMTYYAAMYRYKNGMIRDYFDAQAVHPGGSANPPDTMWPDNPSRAQGWTDHPTFYFRHVEDVRALMKKHGLGNHQIWITEYGWATRNTTPGFEFGNQVSFEQQAEYIVGAMRRTREQYPWVGAMFLWNLNFAYLRARSGQPSHEQASFSILGSDGRPRSSFVAIKQYLAEIHSP